MRLYHQADALIVKVINYTDESYTDGGFRHGYVTESSYPKRRESSQYLVPYIKYLVNNFIRKHR